MEHVVLRHLHPRRVVARLTEEQKDVAVAAGLLGQCGSAECRREARVPRRAEGVQYWDALGPDFERNLSQYVTSFPEEDYNT